MILGSILERFLERCWKGVGEVFRGNFNIFFILLCMSCWKGFGKRFGSNFNSFWKMFGYVLNEFGGHIGMIWLLLFMLTQYSFQMMRSLCQEECEADVSGNSKSVTSS